MPTFTGVAKQGSAVDVTSSATAAALTDSTTGTPSTTIQDVGASFSQSTLDNNFASLTAQINALVADNAALLATVNALMTSLAGSGAVGS